MINESVYKELAEEILMGVDYDIYKEDVETGEDIINMIIQELKFLESMVRKEYENLGE